MPTITLNPIYDAEYRKTAKDLPTTREALSSDITRTTETLFKVSVEESTGPGNSIAIRRVYMEFDISDIATEFTIDSITCNIFIESASILRNGIFIVQSSTLQYNNDDYSAYNIFLEKSYANFIPENVGWMSIPLSNLNVSFPERGETSFFIGFLSQLDFNTSGTADIVTFASSENASREPYIVINYSKAPTGYSNSVSGVSSNSISSVSGTLISNISSIGGAGQR